MDKYEYKVRSEEISKLIDKEKYAEAVKIADTIDWRRVKSVTMLLRIAALYRVSRRNDDSREMLMLAYDRYPTNRSVVHSLCELSIEMDDVVSAIEYYKQFVKLAPKDSGVFTLRYRILEAQEVGLEERIEVLEELKKRDYQEEWAYELAYLYHRVGLATKCVEECDDIILWFGDGPYVMKAMELKAMHVPLTDIQQKNYDIMLGNAAENYSGENYDYGSTDADDKIVNFNARNNNIENVIQDNYDSQDYSTEGYDENFSVYDFAGDRFENDAYGQESYQETYIEETHTESGYEYSNYAQDGYSDRSYEQKQYNAELYAGNNGYVQSAYGTESYDSNNDYAQYPDYGQGEYGAESYQENHYGQGEYVNTPYAANSSYEQNEYSTEPYADNNSYGQTAYNTEPYRDHGSSGQTAYGNEQYTYTDNQYGQNEYGNGQYAENGYEQADYTNEQYTDNSYDQNHYVDDGYGNLSYNDGTYQDNGADQNTAYQDNGYTGAFYVEQIYDENGNLINPDKEAEQNYLQTEEQTISGPYRNGLHLVENKKAASGAGDMSQYNTINLQKVVAESMKELFPDDDEDVFAEDREKYNSDEDIRSITERNTRVFANIANTQAQRGKMDVSPAGEQGTGDAEEPYTYYTQTGRIAQMVTGVSETAPEPHTGAIKKVYVPGEDARLIKSDADMNELRDITEKSVSDEQSWMESNEENVYHEQSIMEMGGTNGAPKARTTGPMKIDEVLVEWERMKLDNAKKHQEEIKQHVLSQTGKLFDNFDNSIKSGILGELEREEEEARRSSQADKASRKERAARKQFLDADVTGDIPQRTASEDEFDVEYVTEHTARATAAPGKQDRAPASEKPVKTEKSEAELREAYLDMLERVISRELGKEAGNEKMQDGSAEYEPYAQEEDTGAVTDAAGDFTESTAYAPESYAEYETGEYTPERDAEGAMYETGEYEAERNREGVVYEAGEYEPAGEPEAEGDETGEYTQNDDTASMEYEKDVYISENYTESAAYETGAYISADNTSDDGDRSEEDAEVETYESGTYESQSYADSTVYESGGYEPTEAELYESIEAAEAEAYESIESAGAETYEPTEAVAYESVEAAEAETYEPTEAAETETYEPDRYTSEYYGENAEYALDRYESAGSAETDMYEASEYTQEIPVSNTGYTAQDATQELYAGASDYIENASQDYTQKPYAEEPAGYAESYRGQKPYAEEPAGYAESYRGQKPYAEEPAGNTHKKHGRRREDIDVLRRQQYQYNEKALDPEDAQSIAEMAMEDALKTQEIKMNTADLSSLSEKIVAATKKEAKGAKREELREFTPEEQTLFENFAVTKKIKKQIIHALENMTLTAYTGNVIITGDAGLDTVRMAKNLVKEYQASDESFSGKLAKITGEKINQRNLKDVFEKLNNGGIIIEKANGMSEEKLYEMALNLNQENLGIVVIMEDTKKEITKLLEKQAMIADYFNIRIDLMEMDNNALVAYAKNYALALEYSIDELGTLALYTRIANMQSGNHVVTKDEVRDIIDEAIWKSKKSKIKNFVDVLFARRYDNEDMIVLKERDFM